MNYEMYKFSPWGDLIVKRYKAQQKSVNKFCRTSSDLNTRLRNSRKTLLGSWISLANLVTEDNKADDRAIECLKTWLSIYASNFSAQDSQENYEDFFDNFFYFGLYMYTTDEIGEESIDDLIQLANCYIVLGPRVYWDVVYHVLPKDVAEEFNEWMGVDDYGYSYKDDFPSAPRRLEEYVASAVAALLGAMREPECE